MTNLSSRLGGAWPRRLLWPAVTAALLGLRIIWPPRGLDDLGLVALRDASITLAMWAITIALAHGLGSRLLAALNPEGITPPERAVWSTALGLGALGYLLLALGLLGAFNRAAIGLLLLGLAFLVGDRVTSSVCDLWLQLRRIPLAWRQAPPIAKAVVAIGGLTAFLSFVNSLSPPGDYDGLMYHLVGPRLFLEAGRLYPYPDNWYVNAPFTSEMLFGIGMAFGDDVFPRLIHFSFWLLFGVGTLVLAGRWLHGDRPWVALAVILGLPTLPIFASFAYIDLAWSSFEWLSIGALIVGVEKRDRAWCVLSGVMLGFALGSKYLALHGLLTNTLLAFLLLRREGWRIAMGAALTVGLAAIVVSSPWYLKNLIWLGNPVFPFYIGGPGWDSERLRLYTQYLHSFGTGTTIRDYLLLPLNLYVRHVAFGTVMNRIDFPNVLFPLVIAYPLGRRNRAVSALLGAALLRFVLWSVGSQQLRFLLPVFPSLAIGVAQVLPGQMESPALRSFWRKLWRALAVGIMVIPLFYQAIIQVQLRPLSTIVGAESRRVFLSRAVTIFDAVMQAQRLSAGQGRLLIPSDGRGYYCMPECIPDPDHYRWSREIVQAGDDAALASWLFQRRISYVLLSLEDLDFRLQHDQDRVTERAIRRLRAFHDRGCLDTVYEDDWTTLFAVTCRPHADG